MRHLSEQCVPRFRIQAWLFFAGLLSGYDISADRLGPVLWYPKGLYAAYLQELGPEYHDLPERYAHMMIRLGSRAGKSEPVALTWLEVARLDEFRRQSCVPPPLPSCQLSSAID